MITSSDVSLKSESEKSLPCIALIFGKDNKSLDDSVIRSITCLLLIVKMLPKSLKIDKLTSDFTFFKL